MPAVRLALVVAFATALVAGVSSAGAASAPPRPSGLKAFLLTAAEPEAHVFPRTPSFAWNPVKGALRYEFQLATRMRFDEGSIVWSNVNAKTQTAPGVQEESSPAPATTQDLPSQLRQLRAPALALPVALPWITGEPYSLYARVRAVARQGASRWSAPFGFNVRWTDVAKPLASPAGVLRWTPVDGATSYDLWIGGAHRAVITTTNLADLRELYNFHPTPDWIRTVHWRVRAQRKIYGAAANGLPATSYGPWSPVYTTTNPDFVDGGPIKLTGTISGFETSAAGGRAHKLMPAFTWTGTGGAGLWRVYVATDRDCVNIVFRGAVVGAPAYAPRASGTLKMPHDVSSLLEAAYTVLDIGPEGESLMPDGTVIEPTEGGSKPPAGGSSTTPTITLSKTDLWDNAWPHGGYYWTVVPVFLEAKTTASGTSATGFIYRDGELPQDACQSGRWLRFGKASDVVAAKGDAPYATGMSTRGLLQTARPGPTFYGAPLVAWQPALGAEEYEVEWSKSGRPWRRAGSLPATAATSAVLPLTPGRWYYRVRGLNLDSISRPEMAWSAPVRVDIAKPVFRVARTGR